MANSADPMLPVGTNYCLCRACGAYFGGVGAFDLHQSGASPVVCLPPSEVTDRHGRKLLRQDERGYWRRSYGNAA